MIEFVVIYEHGRHIWSAYVPDLPGCVSVGKTRPEVEQNIREAIDLHLEGMREDGQPIPVPTVEAGIVTIAA